MADSTPASRSGSPNRRLRRSRSRSPLQEKRSKSQIRSPLQEKTSSETNASRSGRNKEKAKETAKSTEVDIFSSTPFPTKPQHILLPSTIRKQKSFHNNENDLPSLFGRGQMENWQGISTRSIAADGSRRAPVLQLKKSVTTLRDMYEAQERSSRPSTATQSPALRPTTSSSRLRSASSSDGLAGRYAWANMRKISSDDLALLPSLNEATIRKMDSQSSFASRVARAHALTSSPNYRVLGSSSPKMPIFRDEPSISTDSWEPSSSSGVGNAMESSPNFVRFGRSSSLGDTDNTHGPSSSPNFVKLGTSSPQHRSSSPTPSTTSDKSLKRKREAENEDELRATRAFAFNSSPPYMAPVASSSEPSIQSPETLPFNSSPPEPASATSLHASTPVFRIPARASSESFASSSVHASLQAALSSSPAPPIQYPIVRAPVAAGQTLSIPKRNTRSVQLEAQPFSSRLSPVPSEWEGPPATGRSLDTLEDDTVRSDSAGLEHTGNESQIRIIADDHSHEAADELRALPRPSFRNPPMVPVRTNSLYGTLANSSASTSQSRLSSLRHSMDSRLNSMRSYSHSRQNSLKSTSIRPTSSGSVNANTIVPTWARRYYAGFYRDSFQYLYAPSQNGSTAQVSIAPNTLHTQRSYSLIDLSHQHTNSTSRGSRHSWQSFRNSLRQSLSERLPGLIRPRLAARQSHMTIGIGPLVSHPTQPEGVVLASETESIGPTIRRVSKGKERELSQSDLHSPGIEPAGPSQFPFGNISPENLTPHMPTQPADIQRDPRYSVSTDSVYYDASQHSNSLPPHFRFLPSPHLHRDHRLHTGSSASRGYGHPFNPKPKFQPSTVFDQTNISNRPTWFSLDWASTHVFAFILGFVCPLSWFVASFIPLPPRPSQYNDIEKAEWDNATLRGTRTVSEWEELDVVARLRMERHMRGMEEVRWQNARWWRRMNRFMSAVGLVVIVVAVVLSVIGTRGGL